MHTATGWGTLKGSVAKMLLQCKQVLADGGNIAGTA